MWGMALVIAIVLAAAIGVGWSLYHSATGKARCSSCAGCGRAAGPEVEEKQREAGQSCVKK